ncbi:MAG TPA: hypothetical protein VEV63_01285 [Streptosporangiaceae bacterium]|nr:hypothetical protein [Streptosporangiaceae bacterium]
MRAIVTLTVLLALGCAGCGLQARTAGGHKAPPRTSTSTAAPVKLPVRCVRLRNSPGQRTVSLTHANNHGSFCVTRGTGIFVFLHESTPVLWAPIRSSSAVLERRPSGVMALVRGETGAFFEAVKVGTAKLTSFEPRCPNGPHPGVHTRARCAAPLRFSVTVHVLI